MTLVGVNLKNKLTVEMIDCCSQREENELI